MGAGGRDRNRSRLLTGSHRSRPKAEQGIGRSGPFIESELYDAPNVLDEKFDIVYTGIGAICWLPDIRGCAKVVNHFLKPCGVFYILEGHPMMWTLDDALR